MATTTELDDRFAIIGLGCRLPPSGTSLAAFWRFLLKGGDGLKPLRKDRWDWRKYFDEDQNRPGKTYQPKAAYLDGDYRLFDPGAFGISPREASFIDPQQRLLLEIAWEAFEDAGIPLEKASNSLTGVFIGAFCIDHLVHQVQPSNRYLVSSHSTVGASMTIISNRLSHAFNLRGPSLTLDTACSSSLVALHYACQSLRLGESDMVLAGGVNMMTRPEYPIMMSKGHFLSPHGECRAFDESAAGYARGEGAGIVVLKTLRKALEDGDPIHAVIRGSGCNQDGRTDGISLPNSVAQGELLESLYRKCGVAPADVDYVEAHGTGTQAGDPAEAFALNTHFSRGRGTKKLPIGSVKSNIGHLEAAAGMAGLFKAIGILKNRQIPKNLHFKNPNPKIPFADYCLEVVRETIPLPSAEEKPSLIVGVNSFGYGGTNAHIVLESAPPPASATVPKPASERLQILPFSAHSEKARRDLAGKVAFQLGQAGTTISDLAYTAAFRRSHLTYRYAALAENAQQLRDILIAASTGQPQPALVEGEADGAFAASGLVFVYTGMGPQWWAMGRELMAEEPIVAEAISEIDGHFLKLAGWSLKEAMLADEASSRMERTEVAQTANFALQVALTRLWQSWGIHPAAVVGHSVGEVTSAYIAGVYSLEDAVRVSYHRSHLQQTMAGLGAMLAVGLAEEDARKLIESRTGVSIAAINSFSGVTLSGDKTELAEIAALLETQGVFHRFLRVEVAYHSPQMDPLHAELLEALKSLKPEKARIPLYSTVHGTREGAWDAEYWWMNVRQSVRFADAMKALLADNHGSFLEVGPHPVLSSSIKECAGYLEKRVRCYFSLKRKEAERRMMLTALGEMYCAGHSVNWTSLVPEGGKFLPAPAYPWQRQNHWLESERCRIDRLGSSGPIYLETALTGPGKCWEVEVNRNYFPFLFDHGVQDQIVFPGMGYVEAAIVLGQHLFGNLGVVLENVSFEKVLIVDYSRLQYLISEFDAESGRFAISSRVEGEEGNGLRHCRGRMWSPTQLQIPKFDLKKLQAECGTAVTKDAFYERLARRGLNYGPAFRPTAEIVAGDDKFLVRIDGTAAARDDNHPLHPTLFDAAAQPILFCAKGDRLFVPFACERFTYYGKPGEECYAYGCIHRQTDTMILGDIWLLDASGEALAHMANAVCQVIDTELKVEATELYYAPAWKPTEPPSGDAVDGSRILIFGEGDEPLTLLTEVPGALAAAGTDVEAILSTTSRDVFVVFCGADLDIDTLNEWVVSFLQAVIKCRSNGADVTFITRGARAVMENEPVTNLAAYSIGALGLVAQNESGLLTCRSVDGPSAAEIMAEIGTGVSGDVAYRDGQRYENVLDAFRNGAGSEKYARIPVEVPLVLRAGTKGKFDELHYETADVPELREGEIEVRVQRSALNQDDLLKLEGRHATVAGDITFFGDYPGMECAGVVTRTGPDSPFQTGDRVAGLLQDGFRSRAMMPEAFAVRIPDKLGWEAAGIPLAYLTAYRGLIDIARVQKGERVLIQQATGGVGMAAISIAKWAGAEIFALAGSDRKRKHLRELGISHVYSSRDLDFADEIRRDTGGEGVDVVIGAQGGQTMHVSLSCLRAGGRYIATGKKDMAEDHGLPLRAFSRNLLFATVDIDRLMRDEPKLIGRTLATIFEWFAEGAFEPGLSKTVAAGEIGTAFQEMAEGEHMGKLLVSFSEGEVDVLERDEAASPIKPGGTYIVTGGTSGFGLVTAQWLADQGAGRIILASRSGQKATGMSGTLDYIKAKGAEVDVVSVDVTNFSDVSKMIAGAEGLRGIFHGAMVLDDALMTDVTPERFRKVMGPKVSGALNLAAAIKEVPELDFLVFFSSISSLVGNRGQTAYVAANALLDGLALKLRAENVPAISINWGALAEVGVVARDAQIEKILSSAGIIGLTNQEAVSAMELALQIRKPQLGVFRVEWDKWHEGHPKLAEDPRFRELLIAAGKAGGGGVAEEIRQAMAGLSKEQRLLALEGYLQEVLAATLRMTKENVPVNRKINEMGVDSLMVLELGLGIKERLGITFSAMEFLKGPSLQQLAVLAETRLWRK